MTLELRTIRYRPASQGRVNAAYEAALPARVGLSPLGGYFNVDVGPLNSAIEMFWYPDRPTRDEAAAAAEKLDGWPIATPDILEMGEVTVLDDAPFNEPIGEQALGGIYELRMYEIERGSIDDVVGAWSERVEGRRGISPFVGAWSGPGEAFDYWVHLWPYADAGDRQRSRAAAASVGIWPPHAKTSPLHQDNLLMIPAPFSPLH